eukprot:CAMPEP_0185694970 /NCGR_PEP_ID=MMETSP1164-20130828/4241_1 /TAXON_ID=1104430 /ORGANISM="Chrysoreinhardia sp, Strain CCMP2950" /LENGTH=167 /DNA_ID=CAMNT_0028361829 /DNA_START=44 /DNA_END=544 /DNA_ORIENTATION=-
MTASQESERVGIDADVAEVGLEDRLEVFPQVGRLGVVVVVLAGVLEGVEDFVQVVGASVEPRVHDLADPGALVDHALEDVEVRLGFDEVGRAAPLALDHERRPGGVRDDFVEDELDALGAHPEWRPREVLERVLLAHAAGRAEPHGAMNVTCLHTHRAARITWFDER